MNENVKQVWCIGLGPAKRACYSTSLLTETIVKPLQMESQNMDRPLIAYFATCTLDRGYKYSA